MTEHLSGEESLIGWQEAVAVARGGDLLATFVAESPTGLLARDYDPSSLESGDGFWLPALWICPDVGGKRLIDLTAEERQARQDRWTRLGRELRAWFGSFAEQSHPMVTGADAKRSYTCGERRHAPARLVSATEPVVPRAEE